MTGNPLHADAYRLVERDNSREQLDSTIAAHGMALSTVWAKT